MRVEISRCTNIAPLKRPNNRRRLLNIEQFKNKKHRALYRLRNVVAFGFFFVSLLLVRNRCRPQMQLRTCTNTNPMANSLFAVRSQLRNRILVSVALVFVLLSNEIRLFNGFELPHDSQLL